MLRGAKLSKIEDVAPKEGETAKKCNDMST
jgi:hypothetical protein